MPSKKPFIVSLENPYHITGRCLNKDWFALPLDKVWQILTAYLYFVSNAYQLKIHAFVLMTNHFHLIASSPTGELSQAMQFFMSQSSRELAKESKRINHIWGSRFFRCEITSDIHYLNCYKYLYRNPVIAGITSEVENYQFSTLHGLLGQSSVPFPMKEDNILFQNVEETLEWLNRDTSKVNLEAIKTALKKRKFKLPKVDSRPHPLEYDTI